MRGAPYMEYPLTMTRAQLMSPIGARIWRKNQSQWIHSASSINYAILCSLLLLVSPLCCGKHCSLYEPPAPGIVCLHSNELTRTLTNSSTSWMVEFYSSWCGHCQHFAPTMKEIGEITLQWSRMVRIGVIDCSEGRENQEECSKYGIQGFPTLKFFNPQDAKPVNFKKSVVGSRSKNEVLRLMMDHVLSLKPLPHNWPRVDPLTDDEILKLLATQWTPLVLIFEKEESYLGKELILDFSSLKSIRVNRVFSDNRALVKHYSILEFPSCVVEIVKDDFHVIAGHSFKDRHNGFKAKIMEYLNKNILKLDGKHASLKTLDRKLQLPVSLSKLSDGTKRNTGRRINRVDVHDLLSTVSYALRNEVSIHTIISSSAFSSLLRFVTLLESAFRYSYPAASENLQAVRIKLESRAAAGFILNRDWNRLLDTRLDPTLFPVKPKWKNCNGSQPHLRGYPCGLWMLMHTLTILTLPVHHHNTTQTIPTLSSREALSISATFVKNFFSCDYCRQHFTTMAQSLSRGTVSTDGDAILWLWEAHNSVNLRLRKDISSDPSYPKVIFPPQRSCPYCYNRESLPLDQSIVDKWEAPDFNNTWFLDGESFLQITTSHRLDKRESGSYVWNRTAVLFYLWNFYHFKSRINGNTPHVKLTDILHVAWPKKYLDASVLHKRYLGMSSSVHHGQSVGGLGFSHVDTGLCVMSYGMCVLFLAVIGYLLVRRKRIRRLFVAYP